MEKTNQVLSQKEYLMEPLNKARREVDDTEFERIYIAQHLYELRRRCKEILPNTKVHTKKIKYLRYLWSAQVNFEMKEFRYACADIVSMIQHNCVEEIVDSRVVYQIILLIEDVFFGNDERRYFYG